MIHVRPGLRIVRAPRLSGRQAGLLRRAGARGGGFGPNRAMDSITHLFLGGAIVDHLQANDSSCAAVALHDVTGQSQR